MKTDQPLRPGERVFALILALASGFAFAQSYAISGFSGLTTGGVTPMLASGVMIVSSLVILAETLRRPSAPDAGLRGVASYLFPLHLVIMAGLIAAYAVAIPTLGFLAASGAYLWASIWFLWRKGPLWSLLISGASIGAIYVLFRLLFQVVFPIGSLWR